MNLILLEDEDFISASVVCLVGRRLKHFLEVCRGEVGDRFRVGKINGLIGEGVVRHFDDQRLELEVQLDQPPPVPLEVTLLLALPRPKMLKRVLQSVTSLGVKRIYLLNSFRVEKSFWGSPLLQPESLREQLLLGLEQARDTILPQVFLRPRFKPFVEDELPQLAEGTAALVAHPAAAAACPNFSGGRVSLAVGPEGGFIPFEIEKFQECGFSPVSLGQRILRVETVVPVLLSRLAPK